jgi:ELWxxDGT repeat protein
MPSGRQDGRLVGTVEIFGGSNLPVTRPWRTMLTTYPKLPTLRRRSVGKGRPVRLAAALGVALALVALPVGQALAADAYDVSEVLSFNGASVEMSPGTDTVAGFDGQLYFAAMDGAHGYELWKSDGVTASRVTDIAPGSYSSFPEYLTVFDGALYFTASDSTSGYELWKWDGSAATRVLDLYPGSLSSAPSFLTVLGTSLVFSADDGVDGNELWSYSGGTATQLADINPGAGLGSNPFELTTVGDTVFFEADDGTNGQQLWSWDGTSATMLTSVPSSPQLQLESPTEFQGELYFTANDGGNFTLWHSDGTLAGTGVVPAFATASSTYRIAVAGSVLYVSTKIGGFYDLWTWDGTTATRATFDGSYTQGEMVDFNGTLYFTLRGPDVDSDSDTNLAEGEGSEFWRLDGNARELVADLSTDYSGSMPDSYFEFDGALYFRATPTGADGSHLYRLSLEAASDPDPDPELAATGIDPTWPLLAALSLILVGAGAGFASRRYAARRASASRIV